MGSTEATDLLAAIRSKPWPASPMPLNPGETVVDVAKLVSHSEACLRAMEGLEDKPAYKACLSRLQLLNQRLDERVERDAGGVPGEAGR